MSEGVPIDQLLGGVKLDSSLGAVFIGTVIAGVFWGITCSQVFHYFTTRPKDVIWIKCAVVLTWVFDTVHQTLIYVQLYQYTVTHFGDFLHLFAIPSSSPIEMSFIPATALVVHVFYAHKIWRLSEGNKLIVFPIIMMCIAELALGIALVVTSATTVFEWEAQLKADRPAGVAHSAVSFILDSSITASMVYLLRRNRSEYVQTASIVGKLVVFILSTNMVTALLGLSIFIIYLVYPNEVFIIPLSYLIVRLYTNSFMAALNMRPYLKHNHRAAFEDTLPVTIGAASAQAWSDHAGTTTVGTAPTARGYATNVSHMRNMSGDQAKHKDIESDQIIEITPQTLTGNHKEEDGSPVAADKVSYGWA